jgi:hypothetical protein
MGSPRKALTINRLIDEFGIPVLGALWLKVGHMIVDRVDRAEGGDPNVIIPAKALSFSQGRIYATLDQLTSIVAEAFFDRDSRFDPRRLRDFVDQVDRWRRGDRTPATVVRIGSTFNMARVEVIRSVQGVTADHEAGHANRPSPPNPNTLAIGTLTISQLTRRVALGQKSAVIAHPTAFQVFLHIAKAQGAVVASKEIKQQVPGCRRRRLDLLIRRHLPGWVRALIPATAGPNGGYALLLP